MSEGKKVGILKEVLGDFYREGAQQLLFHCPRCSHHKKKLSVNIEKDVFKCWVCDYSGRSIYRLVRRFGTHRNRIDWSELTNRIDPAAFSRELFETKEEKEQIIELPKEFISLVNKNLPPTSAWPLNYLYSRGLTKEDIVRWKIGYCYEGEYASRTIVPSFGLSGGINYFTARTYIPNEWKRYINPPVMRDIVFNHLYLDFDEDLTITEGIFDAIVAGPNAVPILGSTLRERSKLFQEIVKNDTPVYIALDPDAEKKAMRLIANLLKYGIETYKIDIAPYSDVGEMSRKEFNVRKQKATVMNTTNYLLRTIAGI
jgi:hypothetical protein